MMKRTVYEAPLTEHFQVELEGVFCASVGLDNGDANDEQIKDHEVNTDFGENGSFNTGGWD